MHKFQGHSHSLSRGYAHRAGTALPCNVSHVTLLTCAGGTHQDIRGTDQHSILRIKQWNSQRPYTQTAHRHGQSSAAGTQEMCPDTGPSQEDEAPALAPPRSGTEALAVGIIKSLLKTTSLPTTVAQLAVDMVWAWCPEGPSGCTLILTKGRGHSFRWLRWGCDAVKE